MGDVEGGVEVRAGGVLDAVFGPEGLRAVGDADGLEVLFAGMGGGEGDVAGGCQSWVRMTWSNFWARELMRGTTWSPSATDRAPLGAEVVLNVDDEEGVVRVGG